MAPKLPWLQAKIEMQNLNSILYLIETLKHEVLCTVQIAIYSGLCCKSKRN